MEVFGIFVNYTHFVIFITVFLIGWKALLKNHLMDKAEMMGSVIGMAFLSWVVGFFGMRCNKQTLRASFD